MKANKNKKMSSFKSNENIHKKEDVSYYVVRIRTQGLDKIPPAVSEEMR